MTTTTRTEAAREARPAPRPSIFPRTLDRYARYRAEVEFDRWLMAGVPSDPKLIEGWIRSRAGVPAGEEVMEMMRRTLIELGVELPEHASYEQMVKASSALAIEHHQNVFKRNGDGPYIEARQVKAMLREAVSICFPYPKFKWGPTKKTPKSLFAEYVTVEPDEIGLGDAPVGVHLWIGHPRGPQGVRANLTHVEYGERPTLAFEVEVREDWIKPGDWAAIWQEAERQGLGALRSQGFGRFRCVAFEKEA